MPRSILCFLLSTFAFCLLTSTGGGPLSGAEGADRPIRVLAWSERSEPVDVYPNGINGAMVEAFKGDKKVIFKVANLADPEQGLSESALAQTDVLIWFGHKNHKDVTDENVERVVRHVMERGMGYLPLHSAHYARPFKTLMEIKAKQLGLQLQGTTGGWKRVRNEGKPEVIHVLEPNHPIAKGIRDFTIPKTEMYMNPFIVPPPDVKVLEGSWEGGEEHGSDGMCWTVGKGKVFYLRPGHETHPIFYQPEVQAVIRNAVRWLASEK